MRYVEVLPLTKTGSSDQCFTYEFDGDIKIGSLVSVPIRNRTVRGMVTKIAMRPKFATRQVKKIQSEEPVLSEIQLEIAHRIANYYFASLGDVISTMLPFDFGKKRQGIKAAKQFSGSTVKPLKLTADQKKIFDTIQSGKKSSKYLLFGVTGSGKTEIYLQLIANALEKGKSAIVLVPEISLTPQALERYEARFGDKVAVWHSQLKETEKFDTWQKIKSGEKNVVIGARSAIFAPINDLEYIFIDEEHETSYKQDQAPRYETGRVAEWLCDLTGAKLILGSATPKIETYFKSQNNRTSRQARSEYRLCSLSKRIVQDSMPPVKVIDLRDEFRKGNKSIISDDLYEATSTALKAKKQVIFFVNRRGASTFVVCRDCGFVSECPNCEIPLTYHPSEGEILKCHHCNFRTKVPIICPQCKSHAIRYFGLGTQRAEIEAKKMFPKARIIRMDRDTTKTRGSHETIYHDFSTGKFDILIGTQMIAKGWDLPNVFVVGVISADTMLNLPDFKSAERTFSLLTQVAGRTGRGYHPGSVIIQTYNPENFAIRCAAKHDFVEFYEREIKDRQKYLYPPFSDLIKLTFASKDNKKAEKEANRMALILDKELVCYSREGGNLDPRNKSEDDREKTINKIHVLGPSPAFIERLAGKYRWQIVIKVISDRQSVIRKKILMNLKENLKPGWIVDVNPEGLI